MSFRVSLLFLTMTVVVVCGQKRRLAKEEWNYRDGSERVSMRGVANLTQVLDDWRFDILNQVKGLMQHDHQSLLPDYSRYTFMRFNQTLRFRHSFFPQTENSRNTTLLFWYLKLCRNVDCVLFRAEHFIVLETVQNILCA
uniref:Si:ch211-76l23.4 n=1 Tax=Sinocyclocheilus rhinocerous TaxID=307959 RepID=A0A673KJT5_9TELE